MSIPTVAIIEDDPLVAKVLHDVLQTVNIQSEIYVSAEHLSIDILSRFDCVIADVRLPGISGFKFQKSLSDNHISTPVILITGYSDVAMAVQAIKNGAVHFMLKPINNQELIDTVFDALLIKHESDDANRAKALYFKNLNSLTKREEQVLRLINLALSSKEISTQLNISRNTVEVHRANIMQKMQVSSSLKLLLQSIKYEPARCLEASTLC